MHQRRPEALQTARARVHLSPRCLPNASKRDVTRKCYTHAICMFPSHHLCSRSRFQLFLLFLHPRPSIASSSSLQPPPVALRESLKFSEIEMCLVSAPDEDPGLNISHLSFSIFSAQASKMSHPPASASQRSAPPCVFPVVPACVFIIQTLCMCYRRAAINLPVP